MKKMLIGSWLLLGLVMFSNNAEAYIGKVSGYMTVDKNTVNVGEEVSAKIMMNTGSAKVSVVYLNLIVDTSKLKVKSVTMNRSKFGGVYLEKESGGVISLYGTSSSQTSGLPTGTLEVGSIVFEATANGNVPISIKTYEVTGPSDSSDYSYQLEWTNSTVTVNGSLPIPTSVVGNGSDGILKFRMSFAGVMAGAACANNWPVSVTVMSGGLTKTFSNISVSADGEANGRKMFKGEVLLNGFSGKNNIAVFLKGPRHLQVKYGKNSQTEFYNTAGGTLSVDSNSTLTPVYDFSNYPLTVGDVTGTGGKQDGAVDGLDFSYVKTEVNKRSEGNNMIADLNGNCKLESQDLSMLMLAMKDKMEQLY